MGYFESRLLRNTIGVCILVVLVGLQGVLFSLIDLKHYSGATGHSLILSLGKD